ncbi:hypothetical protein LEN26_003581 [Aphanomyces euteiches]|uniref:ELM2 domain-containing protein n=1 Tax=Aphanomyces euteiches TaxID=100861 RepID=A0A6G0XF23_9STRA|nr:hypothetical protein Ae201684_005601 [Aphanomyces euteiches]KAH9078231.1 hypothetical protein Ae201684P_019322 [Aphanomyces euteiches]KAH9140706.1 hypothetical protein AeRB84_015082 [Aphanomyces euteiches]KAH9153223.1 hypothetical protein LEN26_003581 [Aphanomyces euteiches]
MMDHDAAELTCFFDGCSNPKIPGDWACLDHVHDQKCKGAVDCHAIVTARGLCAAHNKSKKQCVVPGCQAYQRKGGLCSRHNPHKKQCSEPGCTSQPHNHGRCVRHGGGRFCKVDGCTAHAREGSYCSPHFRMHQAIAPPVQEDNEPDEEDEDVEEPEDFLYSARSISPPPEVLDYLSDASHDEEML